jgi:hypothetical protein
MCPIYSTSGTQKIYRGEGFMVMVFKATFNHVSVLLCLQPLLKIFQVKSGFKHHDHKPLSSVYFLSSGGGIYRAHI